MERAYFVKYPRVIERLTRPHLISDERPYEIVKVITLAAIDYENFVTDMEADRQFIEDAAELCAEGEVMKCLLVRRRGKRDGVLVVPGYKSYVKWAAYVAELE
ncbi:MAG TPA: hypothetical protein PLN48_05885 [Lachnospiraceae bacterium]|nr:hypothetical protein [Lachnospiraceae bacterium]